MNRRTFIGATAGLAAGLSVPSDAAPQLPKRRLGKTSRRISIIGFGLSPQPSALSGPIRPRGVREGRQLLRRGPELRQRRGGGEGRQGPQPSALSPQPSSRARQPGATVRERMRSCASPSIAPAPTASTSINCTRCPACRMWIRPSARAARSKRWLRRSGTVSFDTLSPQPSALSPRRRRPRSNASRSTRSCSRSTTCAGPRATSGHRC